MRNKLNSIFKSHLILCIFFFCTVQLVFSQKVASLHAIFDEQTALLIPQAEGSWTNNEISLAISIKKAGDNFYSLTYGANENRSSFEAVFFKLNDILLLDLSGVMSDNLKDDFYRGSFLNNHTLFKVQVTKEKLSLSSLDYVWFNDAAQKNKLSLRYEWLDKGMLITSQRDEWMLFFSKHEKEEQLFKPFGEFIKESSGDKDNISSQPDNYSIINPVVFPQKCLPEFPLKDGWLGGDGDVSVSLSETKTLFIFSDTYVAAKDQKKRGGDMQIVSNTVAVQTCLAGGKMEVQYFWNNMYMDNPEPLFKSFTNRYRFWVNDAFMLNGYLYVVLVKIGSKKGAATGEIFNFSQQGYAFAKISNPFDSPDKWRIELISLPDFSSPAMEIQTHVIRDNYLYLFINRYHQEQLLVRKKLELLDFPQISFEYYSSEKAWVSPIRKEDMYVLINGFRPTTVNYHPDIKLWVMICDISFMENKIKIRTAPELTGPWSDEIMVYECPEITPGNSLYNKSNFCYLPRECIQNYNMKNHEMLITYDINNSNVNEINSNPKIYTPKVIKISLRQYLPKK